MPGPGSPLGHRIQSGRPSTRVGRRIPLERGAPVGPGDRRAMAPPLGSARPGDALTPPRHSARLRQTPHEVAERTLPPASALAAAHATQQTVVGVAGSPWGLAQLRAYATDAIAQAGNGAVFTRADAVEAAWAVGSSRCSRPIPRFNLTHPLPGDLPRRTHALPPKSAGTIPPSLTRLLHVKVAPDARSCFPLPRRGCRKRPSALGGKRGWAEGGTSQPRMSPKGCAM